MTVIIAKEAENDLEEISAFIAIDNPQRAISFVQELVASCQSLAVQPLRHAIVADYGQRLRRFPYRGYSIYYQVDSEDRVVIVHILADAMDHRRFLSPN